ncbi:hypothetical protein E4U54_001715 [Claviceps lovelessii]|nr:hypothetical protein E4U54_001715 [Claviceps lovelessii]
MQYLSLLLAAVTVASAAVMDVNKRFTLTKYCHDGVEDDGTCWGLNMRTYCCVNSEGGSFTIPVSVVAKSFGQGGTEYCDGAQGRYYCA